jgi:hypothetical protein
MLSTSPADIDNIEPIDPLKRIARFLTTKAAKNAMVAQKRNGCLRLCDRQHRCHHRHANQRLDAEQPLNSYFFAPMQP